VSLTQPRVPMLLPLQDPLDALDQIALNFMSTRGIWGMAANFFIPGSQRAVGRGWGYTTAVWGSGDGEEPPRMRPDSRVRVGSISRLLTAIALLQLVDAAKLDLDESLLSILERTGTQTAGDPSAEDDSGGGACDGASSASSSESLAPSEPDAPAPNPLIALVADSSGASSTSRRLRATVRQLLQHINGGSSGPDAEALSNGTSCSAHSLLCHLIETLSADGRSYEQYVQEEVLAWCRGVPGSGRAEQTCAPRIEGWLQPSSSGMGSYRSEMGGYYNNKSRAWQLEPAHERLTTPNDVDAAAGGFLLSTREMVQVARATARASANGNTTQVLQPSAAPRVDGRPLLSDESLCILHGSKDGGSLGWTVDKTGENRFQLSGVGGHACLLMSSERQPGVCLAVAMNTCSKFEDVAELEAFAMECLPAVAELAKNGWD
jgi:CubicO group peptidase (beta-lactamase class C family)